MRFTWVLLLAPSLRPQDEPKVPRVVSATVSLQEERVRVTLQGAAEGKDGSLVLVKALPQVYSLAGDGETLTPSVSQLISATCRAELRRGGFSAALAPTWLLPHEVHTRLPASSPAAHVQVVVFYDVPWLHRKLRQEAQTLLRLQKRIVEFIAEIEPYQRPGQKAGARLYQRLKGINDETASWAESTPLPAAASVLLRILHELWTTVPWAEVPKADGTPDGAVTGYDAPEPLGPMDPAKWARLLAEVPRVALREQILATLAYLEEWAARVERPGWSAASARADLKTLQGLVEGILAGDPRYAPGTELRALVATAVEAASGAEGVALERARALATSVGELRRKTLLTAR